jgi:hypothetical protein
VLRLTTCLRKSINQFKVKLKSIYQNLVKTKITIHQLITESLLMTRRRGLSLSIIIWRIGGGGTSFLFPFPLGPKNSLGGPENLYR